MRDPAALNRSDIQPYCIVVNREARSSTCMRSLRARQPVVGADTYTRGIQIGRRIRGHSNRNSRNHTCDTANQDMRLATTSRSSQVHHPFSIREVYE